MTEIKGVIKAIDKTPMTIIIATITDKDNHDHEVLMDYRMFIHMTEDKGSIIGKQVTYHDATKHITFDEDLRF